jgi:hypothetical protein
MTERPEPYAVRRRRGKASARTLALALLPIVPFTLLLCGGLYACSVPIREATEAYFAAIRSSGPVPYALDSTNAKDAEATLPEIRRSTGFSVWNFHQKSQHDWTRACLFIRLSLPEGGRWMDVALEQHGEEWRVRDLSFERDCNTAKNSGDYLLR